MDYSTIVLLTGIVVGVSVFTYMKNKMDNSINTLKQEIDKLKSGQRESFSSTDFLKRKSFINAFSYHLAMFKDDIPNDISVERLAFVAYSCRYDFEIYKEEDISTQLLKRSLNYLLEKEKEL